MATFFGQYKASLDAQHRLMIPVRLREGLGGDKARLYISPGLEEHNRYLILYGEVFWTQITTRIKEFRNLKEDTSAERKLKKHFFGGTHSLEADTNGRILLPNEVCAYAELKNKCLLVGMQDFIELWSVENWSAGEKQLSEIHKVVEMGAKEGIRLY